MKHVYLILLLGLFSCQQKEDLLGKVNQIETSNFELFANINLQASEIRDHKYRLPFFYNQIKGEKYLLPNFKYFGCQTGDTICLKKGTRKKFDLREFGHAQGYKDQEESYQMTINYIDEIVTEYDKIGDIYKIFSNESLGGGIIFYYREDNYVAYVPDVSKVHNENWKKRFTEENKVKDKWYKGNW